MKSRGALVFVAGSLSWAVAQWFLVWLFARFAGGAVAVGEYSLALAVTTPIFIVGQFGLRTIYLTLRRRHPWSSYSRLRLGGIALAVLTVLGYFLLTTTGDPWIWVALVFQKSVDANLDLIYGKLQRQNRLMKIGVLAIVKTIGTMTVAAIIILATQSVALAVFGAGVVSALITVLARRAALNTHKTENIYTSGSGYREILRAAFPVTVTDGLASVSAYLPLLFLGVISNETVAGKFAAASYLFSLAHIAGGILKNVLITSLRITFEEKGIKELFTKSHRIATFFVLTGLLAAPIVILAGSPVLEFLYGEDFTFNYVELTLLAVAALSITPAYIYSVLLNIINRYDSQAWSLFAAVTFGVAVGIAMATLQGTSAMIVGLAVACAVNWGRLIGVLALTLSVQFGRKRIQ